jgi:hypothetical protein
MHLKFLRRIKALWEHRMKFIKLMVVTLAFILSAASASCAAVAFTSAATLNMMAPNARNGLAGNVALTALSSGVVPVGETLIISYGGAQISVLSTICVKATVAGTTIGFGTTAACTAAGVSSVYIIPATGTGFTGYDVANTLAGVMTVTVKQSCITINFLTGVPFTGAVDGFEFSGVRLNVVPVTSGTQTGSTISATITSIQSQIGTTNPYLPIVFTQNPLSILPGTSMAAFSSNTIGLGSAALVPGPSESVSTITAIEGAVLPNAFVTNGATAPTKVIFQITEIPAGVNVTGAAIAAAPSGYTRVGSTSGSMANGAVVGPITPTVSFTQTGTTATVTVDILSSDPSVQEVAPVTLTFSGAATTLPADAIGTVKTTLGPEVAGASGATLTLPAAGLPFGSAGPVAYKAQFDVNPTSCEVSLNLAWTGALYTNITFGTSEPADFNLYIGIMNYSIPLISAVPIPAIQPPTSVSLSLPIPSYGKVGVLATMVTSEGVICSDWKTVYTGPKAP